MKKQDLAPPETFALVSLSYENLVQTDYVDGKSMRYIGGKITGIDLKLLSGTEYITAKLTGEKPSE